MIYLETKRLLLRSWKEEDLPEFYRLNSHDLVMEYFPQKLSYEETQNFYERIQKEFSNDGFGLYALERKEDKAFLGFLGLHNISFDIDFAPAIEIGWRLLPESWNHGYATEAGSACLAYAKNTLKLPHLFSFTALLNKRSQRVMQKIGMCYIKEFDHPLVAPQHPLCKHVLYKSVL